MSSVVCRRRPLQWSLNAFVVLALVAVLGCQPAASEKKPGSENPPEQTSATETSAPDVPAAAEPADKPAADPASETSAQQAPVAANVANENPDAESDPTMDVTVKWLPKPVEIPNAEANDQAEMKPYTEHIPGTDVEFNMTPIPGGTFKMGSPDSEEERNDDEGPRVEVKLQPFWMGECEVTWEEFELWGLGLDQQRRKAKDVDATLWDEAADALAIPTKPYSDMTFGMGKKDCPAVCMTLFAAKMYCKWLSAKTGRYYRLPTEAEWEYSCRAGTTAAYSCGDDFEELEEYAWFEANSDDRYHKIRKKKPNPWGLYDMHGNVAEWCIDEYIPDRYQQLGKGPVDSPVAVVTKMYPQVVRGGSWLDDAAMLRSAARRGSTKDWKMLDPQLPQSIWYYTDANFVGFRVVRPLHVPTPEEAARYEITDFEKEELIDYKKAQAGKQ